MGGISIGLIIILIRKHISRPPANRRIFGCFFIVIMSIVLLNIVRNLTSHFKSRKTILKKYKNILEYHW
jgi:hypothetical protein